MSKPIMNVKLPKVDDLFTGNSVELLGSENQVTEIAISDIHSFPNHPFRVSNDAKMAELADSIREKGVLVPVLIRPRKAGGYELVSGHRRTFACRILGRKTVPAIIRELTDDDAVVSMVDANIQREKLLPSEKARAYAMKFEALKHQGRNGGNTLEEMGRATGEGAKTVQRYISLASLSGELLSMVDQGKIGVTQGFSLAGLSKEEQECLCDVLQGTETRLTVAMAEQLRNASRSGTLDSQSMEEILQSSGATGKRGSIPIKKIRQFFSHNASPAYMEQVILELLRQWKEQADE